MFPVKQRMPAGHFRDRPRQGAPPGRVPAPPMNPFQKAAPSPPGYHARPPFGPGPPPPIMHGASQANLPGQKGVSEIMSKFKTPEGQLDIEKITTTAQQVHKIYNDISPMVSQFLKNR